MENYESVSSPCGRLVLRWGPEAAAWLTSNGKTVIMSFLADAEGRILPELRVVDDATNPLVPDPQYKELVAREVGLTVTLFPPDPKLDDDPPSPIVLGDPVG